MTFLAEASEIALNLNTGVSVALILVMIPLLKWVFEMKAKVNLLCRHDENAWSSKHMGVWADRFKKENKGVHVPSVGQVVTDLQKTPIRKIFQVLIVLCLLTGCKTAQPKSVQAMQRGVMEMPPLPQSIESEESLVLVLNSVDTITNAIGNDAKRLTFTVSGMNTASNYAGEISVDFASWFPLILWTPTSDTETFIKTNAQNVFFQPAVFMRARTF